MSLNCLGLLSFSGRYVTDPELRECFIGEDLKEMEGVAAYIGRRQVLESIRSLGEETDVVEVMESLMVTVGMLVRNQIPMKEFLFDSQFLDLMFTLLNPDSIPTLLKKLAWSICMVSQHYLSNSLLASKYISLVLF